MIHLPIKKKEKEKIFETLPPRETCDKVDKTWAQTCNPQHPKNSNG